MILLAFIAGAFVFMIDVGFGASIAKSSRNDKD